MSYYNIVIIILYYFNWSFNLVHDFDYLSSTQTQKNKKYTHIIVKQIHSSERSVYKKHKYIFIGIILYHWAFSKRFFSNCLYEIKAIGLRTLIKLVQQWCLIIWCYCRYTNTTPLWWAGSWIYLFKIIPLVRINSLPISYSILYNLL